MPAIEPKYVIRGGGQRPGAEVEMVSRLFKDKPMLFRYFKDLYFELDASPQMQEPMYLEACSYHRERVSWILRHVAPSAGETLLDVACGVGWLSYHASQKGAFCAGFDDAQEQLTFATALSKEYPNVEKRTFLQADALVFPFKPSSFDKICSNDFFEHLSSVSKERVLSEMVRVLKPRGSIFIHTPNASRATLGIYYRKIKAVFSGRNPKEETTAFAHDERGHIGLSSSSWYVNSLKKYGFSSNVYFSRANIPKFKGHLLFMDKLLGAYMPVLKHIFSFSFLVIGRMEK